MHDDDSETDAAAAAGAAIHRDEFTSEESLQKLLRDRGAAASSRPSSSSSSSSRIQELQGPRRGAKNTFWQLLSLIPDSDINVLRNETYAAAQYFRYYAQNATATRIPTAIHAFPSGGAMDVFASFLSRLKASGPIAVADHCDFERKQKHRFVRNYPCKTTWSRRLTAASASASASAS